MCRVSSSSPAAISSPVVILRPEDWLQLGSSIKPTVAPPLPPKSTAESASRVDNPLCNISWNDNRQLPCCAPARPMTSPTNQCRNQVKTTGPSPQSILRASSYKAPTSSESMHRSENTFSLPGLVSAHDDEEDSGSLLSRASSSESLQDVTSVAPQKKKKVHFFNKVSVQEFRRLPGEKDNTWYKPEDIQEFQREAALLVCQYDRAHRTFLGFFRRPHRIVHTHPALCHNSSVDDEDDDDKRGIIKRVLLVDSHDLSLNLFAKSFHKAFPRAVIVTSKSSHEALQLCCDSNNANDAFEIVVAEQRLGLFHRNNSDSGSGLFRVLHNKKAMPHTTLFIGVSAHMERDQDLFLQSGADICWSKPPPLLNDEKKTVEEIIQAVQHKKRTG